MGPNISLLLLLLLLICYTVIIHEDQTVISVKSL